MPRHQYARRPRLAPCVTEKGCQKTTLFGIARKTGGGALAPVRAISQLHRLLNLSRRRDGRPAIAPYKATQTSTNRSPAAKLAAAAETRQPIRVGGHGSSPRRKSKRPPGTQWITSDARAEPHCSNAAPPPSIRPCEHAVQFAQKLLPAILRAAERLLLVRPEPHLLHAQMRARAQFRERKSHHALKPHRRPAI